MPAKVLEQLQAQTVAQGNQIADGGGEGVRTPDLRLAKPALCQTELHPLMLVAGAGFEPATFGL